MSEPIKSGSHQEHSPLSPSGSKTWKSCNIQPSFLAANADRLLPIYVGRVIRLTSYLRSMPEGELKECEKQAIEIAARIDSGGLSVEELTEDQRDAIVRSEGSVASREGTRAHDFAAEILEGQKTLADIPEEFRVDVGGYVSRCLAVVPEGVKPMVETRVSLFYAPQDGGTLDFAVVTNERVHIRDLKYGRGRLVSPVENEQLGIYALSLIRMLDCVYDFGPDTEVVMEIDQPRHHEADPSNNSWVVSLSELESFCRDVEYAAIQIQEGRGLEFCPGEDICFFCDAKSFCKAHEEWATEKVADNFQDLVNLLPDLSKEDKKKPVGDRVALRLAELDLDPKDDAWRVQLYRKTKAIKALLDDNAEALEMEVLGGAKKEGVCLVMGRPGNRKWTDESAADQFLANQKISADVRYCKSLVSPTEAEKLLKDKLKNVKRTATRFDELVTRSEPRKVLALADDKRPAVEAAVDMLKVLDDAEEFEV